MIYNNNFPFIALSRRRVWGRHAIQTSNFPHQRGKILASIAVAPQGFLDYTVDLYFILYFPVQSSQRRHPYELSVSICAYSGVLLFGRDLPRSAPAPHPGQHLRPAATLGRAPLRHREARAGQGSGPVPHRHLPAAVCACRRGCHGAVGGDGRDAAAHRHRHHPGDGAGSRECRPHHPGPHQPPRCKKGGRT